MTQTLYPHEAELAWAQRLLDVDTPRSLPSFVELERLPTLRYAGQKRVASAHLVGQLIRAPSL